jgi:transcription elongation factor/antiterminator RfaH
MLQSDFSGQSGRSERRWFLVHTRPRCELRACMHMSAQGFETFLPQIDRTTRHARQLRTVRASLFPRYLFTLLDLDIDRWLSIQSTCGVSCLYSSEGRPVPVPIGVVENLKAHADEANLSLFGHRLLKGDRVRILRGPFTELIGTLSRLDANGRVRVLLTMMGSGVQISLDRANLQPA